MLLAKLLPLLGQLRMYCYSHEIEIPAFLAVQQLVRVPSGSPNCDIDRTFTRIFFFKPKNFHTKSVNHFYQNPVCLAKEYRRMISSGEVKNQSDLAQKLGISSVRVRQVLRLLKLSTDLLVAVEKIGNPMPIKIVTERMLRDCLSSPEMYKEILSRLNNYLK